MTLDFSKIREENKRKAKDAIRNSGPTVIRQPLPSPYVRLCHLINYHAGEMTEWENNFCLDTKNFCVETRLPGTVKESDLEFILTSRVKNKIAEIEATYCTNVCHALNKAGIPHS